MGRYRRKKMHVNNKTQKKKYRTKRRTKDLDQIQQDMDPSHAERLIRQPRDVDLPGEGQFYCLHCARYFMDSEAMKRHFSSKLHKRRLKALREPVYTHKEAEMAAGIGHYKLPAPPLTSSKVKGIRKKKKSKQTAMEVPPEELEKQLFNMGLGGSDDIRSPTETMTNTGLGTVELQFEALTV